MSRRVYFMGGLYFIGAFAVMFFVLHFIGYAEKFGLFAAFFASMVGTVISTFVQHDETVPRERQLGVPATFKFMLAASFSLLCFMCLMAVQLQGLAWYLTPNEVYKNQQGEIIQVISWVRNPQELVAVAVLFCGLMPVLISSLFWRAIENKGVRGR